MNFNALKPSFELPENGARAQVVPAAGAPDSLALCELAVRAKGAGRLLAVVAADPAAALRLFDEVHWLDPSLNLTFFPDWETLPYDSLSPHEDLVSERLLTLWRLANRSTQAAQDRTDVLICSALTAAQHIAPVSFVTGHTFFFRRGDRIAVHDIRANLVVAGYGHVDQVMAPGEFSLRGGVLDIFPMGSDAPFRLDLFDDEIDQIRRFDTETQRSTEMVDEIRILPGHEFSMDEESRTRFRYKWREVFAGAPEKCPVYTDIGNAIASGGIEYYLPLFFEKTATLSEYLPQDAVIVGVGNIEEAIQAFHTEISDRYRFLSHDLMRPALPPEAIVDNAQRFFEAIAPFARISLTGSNKTAFDLAIDRKAKDPAAKLKEYLARAVRLKRRVLIAAVSPGRSARLSELLSEAGIGLAEFSDFASFLDASEPIGLTVGPLYEGFELASPKIAVLTETELYQARASKRRSRIRETNTRIDAMIRDIAELKTGDPVVHVEHGIGRYQGLETMSTAEGSSEFVRIDYAAGAKLFVPVSQLHQISRYTGGEPENAPLHTLGKGDWEKAKKKAAQKIRDTAAELLNLYALREAKVGFAFEPKAGDYQAFCEGFAFEETPDQAAAIEAVLRDMESVRPMDRLVCGDVGFGKTEVALRAAFLAAMNGKQVAVLCPTTLLAEQHAQTFRDRFANWPVRIAELSRFRSGKETAAALKGLADGTVDIAIGTHKLLSESVHFSRLGLIVIDEEHRFGVRQKEKLKSLRAEVDVLTLTATPIPRTLSMSLEGIRDFSVIATAPERRLAVKTFVRRESKEMIREAVIRELKRGGQVYFLHNDVETILNRKEMLEALLPEARIAVAHGQMNERELESVMRDFYQQRFNVLLCSTIIETGIDVPNANTILIHRADRFGLAQLHQLRGRVGRSHHQAYAYLMTPGEGAVTKNAQKRLDAIQSLEDLGSGFYLSMHDLEIRGAGEVLGDEQSGEMQQVGFELYNQMLKNAVEAMKRGETPEIEHPFAGLAEINLHTPALLPEDYVPDVSGRLALYKKLSAAESIIELESVIDDLNDRFGKPPEAAQSLIATHRIRILSRALGIRKIDAAENAIVITFRANAPIEPSVLIAFLQSRRDARMFAPEKMRITVSTATGADRVRVIREILNALSAPRKEK